MRSTNTTVLPLSTVVPGGTPLRATERESPGTMRRWRMSPLASLKPTGVPIAQPVNLDDKTT